MDSGLSVVGLWQPLCRCSPSECHAGSHRSQGHGDVHRESEADRHGQPPEHPPLPSSLPTTRRCQLVLLPCYPPTHSLLIEIMLLKHLWQHTPHPRPPPAVSVLVFLF